MNHIMIHNIPQWVEYHPTSCSYSQMEIEMLSQKTRNFSLKSAKFRARRTTKQNDQAVEEISTILKHPNWNFSWGP